MTYAEFIKKYNGKGTDFDGRYGVQCVDLAKVYLKEVFGIIAGYWGDAHAYYDNYKSLPLLVKNFYRIAYTSGFVPQKGDIVVWSSKLSSSGCGHIAIASGMGNTKYFYSYDQNWTGQHDSCKLVKHTYNCVLGVLRAKDQSQITGTTTAFATGTYTLTTAVNVRKGAGTKYALKKRSELTANGKANAKEGTYATLKSGTVVTVKQVKKISDKEYWGKIPSGWIALMYNGTKYVK